MSKKWTTNDSPPGHAAVTLRVLPLIVAHRDSWTNTKKDGWQLRMNYVNGELHKAREALWYDEVYFPKMRRMMKMMRAMNVLPTDWDRVDVGYNTEMTMLYPNDTICQEWLDDVFEEYWLRWWQNNDWFYEELKEADIWTFCQRPDFTISNMEMF